MITSGHYVRRHNQVCMFKSGSPPRKPKAPVDSQFDALPLAPNDLMTSRINPLGIAGSLYYI